MTAAGGVRPRRNQRAQHHASSGQGNGIGIGDVGFQIGRPDEQEAALASIGQNDAPHGIARASDNEDDTSAQENDEGEHEEEDGDDEDENDEDEEDEDDDDDDDDDEEEEEEEEEEDDGAGDDDEDDSPFKFLERLDPRWLARKSHPSASHGASSASQAGNDHRSSATGADDTEFYGAMIQMLTHVLGSSDSIAWPNQPTPGSQLAPSPFAHAQSSPAQTPGQAAGPLSVSSRPVASSSTRSSKSEFSALQPMIQALITRLGKEYQLPRRPVGEQDLTVLLQTLMEQQQRQQEQQSQRQAVPDAAPGAYATSSYTFQQTSHASASHGRPLQQVGHAQGSYSLPAHDGSYQPLNFADLDFEDEDEDDPDFNPDLNPDLPLPSAWSMAVRDVVASEESRAAAAAAAVAASHSGTPSGTQTPADGLRPEAYRARHLPSTGRSPTQMSSEGSETRRASLQGPVPSSAPPQAQATPMEPSRPRKRGRKPVLEPGEAQRRRAQRNIEYQRMRRQAKKAEESEQSEAVLELKAEVKMLRAEMERLRDENAMLRAQRELDRLQRSSHG